jgi:hypothetical protein
VIEPGYTNIIWHGSVKKVGFTKLGRIKEKDKERQKGLSYLEFVPKVLESALTQYVSVELNCAVTFSLLPPEGQVSSCHEQHPRSARGTGVW